MAIKPPIRKMRLFYNGDIIMFVDQKISFITKLYVSIFGEKCNNNFITKLYVSIFGEKCNNNYVYSFLDNAKHKYELKTGDIYEVDSHYLGFMVVLPLNVKIKYEKYYTLIPSNFRIVPKNEYKKILRKEKLIKLKDN